MSDALVLLDPCQVPAADQHPTRVYLASLATAGGRDTQARALAIAAGVLVGDETQADRLPWHLLRYQHTAALASRVGERYSPAMGNRVLSAVRCVMKQAYLLGQMPADAYMRAREMKAIKGKRVRPGRALERGELQDLFRACASSATGLRNAAVMALLCGAGLRRAEAVAVKVDDYATTGALVVRRGKGNKDRTTYLTNGAKAAVDAWLTVRGTAPGELLCPITKGGSVQYRKMTPQAILYIVRRLAKWAAVKRFSPHDMRRTYISELLDAGADVSVIGQLVGHESADTTVEYDRRGERAKIRTAELIHLPFEG